MASSPSDLDELTQCSCCKRGFNEDELRPKLLACRHHFCLACVTSVLLKGRELYCPYCWKRTELPAAHPDTLPTHGAVLALVRRLAAGTLPAAVFPAHTPPPPALRGELAQDLHHARLLADEIRQLAKERREFLLVALDACSAVMSRVERELADEAADAGCEEALAAAAGGAEVRRATELRTVLAAVAEERARLSARHRDALQRRRLDDLVRAARAPLDTEIIKRALTDGYLSEVSPLPDDPARDPELFLANYCAVRLHSRRRLPERLAINGSAGPLRLKSVVENGSPVGAASPGPIARPVPRGLSSRQFPLFYFDVQVNGSPAGRFVIEAREDVAPRMSRNFAALTTGELGVGYRGCCVFQCWENESVITGDFELNNGRGGRSVFEESFFVPDESRLAAVRGSVGMRRGQRRHDSMGLVGSQFRIVLREMRGFTGIFGFVADGLPLVDRMARAGDGSGKPHSIIVFTGCGKLE